MDNEKLSRTVFCLRLEVVVISHYVSSSKRSKFDAFLSNVSTHSQPENLAKWAIKISERSWSLMPKRQSFELLVVPQTPEWTLIEGH